MDQVDLPPDRPKQPLPSVGTQVRVTKIQFNRAFPGAPPTRPVAVYDGELLHVVPAGEYPGEAACRAGWFSMRAGTSKYTRVVVRTRTGHEKTITLDKQTRIFPRSEAG